jgi:hypothetical protein
VAITWQSDTPLNTALTVRVRSGATAMPDQTWGQWTMDFKATPADLITNMPLVPNLKNDPFLQVEFDFTTSDKNRTPKLKSFDILYECGNIPG